MRVRDLRWYILSCLVLLISYAAIAFCYYLPVRAKAEESMKVLGAEANQNTVMLLEQTVNTAYVNFVTGQTVTLDNPLYVTTEFSQTGMEGKFADTATGPFMKFKNGNQIIVYGQDRQVTSSDDNSYYFYFLRTNEDGDKVCGKISLEKIFEAINASQQNVFDTFVYQKDGTLWYNNIGTDVGLMQNVLGMSSFSLVENDDSFCQIYSINNQNGVLSGQRFYDIYISIFIPITDPYLQIDWVLQQALMFYIIGIVMLAAMIVILVLGCKKASQLLRVDRHGLESTKAIVIRIDLHGNVIFTNKTFKQVYGIQKLENVENIIDVDTNESILETVKQNKAFECSIEIGEDEFKYFHLSPLKIAQSYYLMGTEITLDYLRRKHLFLMSGRNEVTKCDNAFSLTNNYKHIVTSAEIQDVAFVQYNIVKYEEIIGVFGRNSYNILLNEFLTVIQESFESLAIYHIHDDKFIVIHPHLGLDEVIAKINASLEQLRRPFQIRQNHIYVKCKIVVYNLKKEDAAETELNTILSKLELAYKNIADFLSKDYIVYEPAMDNVIAATEEMEKDLIKGLQNEEFRMHLQPQYDVVNNRIDGFEALIRWYNPKYKEKSPQVYIELAEQRGYMLDLGRFVIKETFKLAKELEPYNVHVSMNVSPIQLLQVGFVQLLIDEYKHYKLKPSMIAIEITETFLMGNYQLMIDKLKMLKEAGFKIHLDDFCTGYSSMLYLKDLPVDTLKIDKEFTKYIETNKVHASIVKTICSLAEALNMDIICEGVETEEQMELAKRYGARLIQGYLIGKALPFDEAVKLIEKYNQAPEKKRK